MARFVVSTYKVSKAVRSDIAARSSVLVMSSSGEDVGDVGEGGWDVSEEGIVDRDMENGDERGRWCIVIPILSS